MKEQRGLKKIFQQAHFLSSASKLRNAPPDVGCEVAFAGRSNSGKSSAINRLTHQRSLARVSKTPGRTQLLNFFSLDDDRRLVDLPGYGYAKVPEGIQKDWGAMIEEYLSGRETLRGVVLVMDIRHPLTDFDLRMIDWCVHYELGIHVLLTKADKLSRGAGLSVVQKVASTLSARFLYPISVQMFSSLKNQGIEEAQNILLGWLPGNHAPAILDDRMS